MSPKTINQVMTTSGIKNTAPSAPASSREKWNCRPDCPTCAGFGLLRYDVPTHDPRFGKLLPCPNLPPTSSIFENHGLTDTERTWSWAGVKSRENVVDGIRILKAAIQRGNGLVYLFGGPGLAKTLLLKIACAEWARSGHGIFHFTKLTKILEDLRTAYDDDEPQRALAQKEEKYMDYPLLAIDEIGAQRTTDFSVEKFFDLVDARHEAGTERGMNILTLMAGNISPSEIDYRIADRLTDGRNAIVRLTGESYRPYIEAK